MGVFKVYLGTVVSLEYEEHLTFMCSLSMKTIPIQIFEEPS